MATSFSLNVNAVAYPFYNDLDEKTNKFEQEFI